MVIKICKFLNDKKVSIVAVNITVLLHCFVFVHLIWQLTYAN